MVDWKMMSVCFSVFQFVFTAIIFAIIKLNDFAHLDKKVSQINDNQIALEKKQDERHIDNIKSMNVLAVQLSELNGKYSATQEIKDYLK